MRVAFGKKLGGIQWASLLDNTVYEEMIFAPEQDHVPTADILNRNPPDPGDILRPHPWPHAGAVNAQGNPAMSLQRVRNSHRIVRAAFPADLIRILPVLFSILHQTSLLKSHRPRLYVKDRSARCGNARAYRSPGVHNFVFFRTGANKDKSFGIETGPTLDIRMVSQGGMVNRGEALACPKLQHSIEAVHSMLPGHERCVRIL